jgi:signal transduction histidine kinase
MLIAILAVVALVSFAGCTLLYLLLLNVRDQRDAMIEQAVELREFAERIVDFNRRLRG